MHEKLIVQAEKLAFSCSYGNVYGNLYMWTNVGSVEQREIPGAIVRETPNTVVKNHFFCLIYQHTSLALLILLFIETHTLLCFQV